MLSTSRWLRDWLANLRLKLRLKFRNVLHVANTYEKLIHDHGDTFGRCPSYANDVHADQATVENVWVPEVLSELQCRSADWIISREGHLELPCTVCVNASICAFHPTSPDEQIAVAWS